MITLSHRLEGVSESATLKLNAAAQAMRAQGIDVINFTAGEPDYHVPDAAKKAVEKALAENKSKYTPVAGILELRELICKKINGQQKSLSHAWTPSDIVVSNGGKQAIFNSLMALLNPGDEVLIPAPYWLSYPEMVKLCGGTPKIIPADFKNGYKITVDDLKKHITPRSKVLFLNSPSNPTGVTYTRAEFQKMGEWIATDPLAKNLVIISDEIYDRIIFTDTPFVSFLDTTPALKERVITVNGMSKSAAMTGWRIGWSIAQPHFTQAIATIQGQCSSGINALAQYASVAALKLPEEDFTYQVDSFRKRRDLTLEILAKALKIKVVPPSGAFYVLIGVGAYMKPGEDIFGFCEELLREAKVALVPGSPFGAPDCVRMSFATDEKSLRTGCERIVGFLGAR
jgi:aspartate aminotransferase